MCSSIRSSHFAKTNKSSKNICRTLIMQRDFDKKIETIKFEILVAVDNKLESCKKAQ